MKKKTTFNCKGLINKTANVTALRKMRISYHIGGIGIRYVIRDT